MGVYSRGGKRFFDLAISAAAIPILAPLLLVLSALVRARLGRPVLFVQARPGLGGRPFPLYKFRTMTDARGPDGSPLPDAERLTGFGRFLRNTSLDEMPELFNVLKGEMSLVGPRPLLMQYLPLYSPEQKRRHDVRPGITGLAQVNGRNALSWGEKFRLDVQYVDEATFCLDIRILIKTVWIVLRRKNISHAGEATMKPFTGEGN